MGKFSDADIMDIIEEVKDSEISYIRLEDKFTYPEDTGSMYLTCFVQKVEGKNVFKVVKSGADKLIMIINEIRERGSKCELLNYNVKDNNTLVADSLLYSMIRYKRFSEVEEMYSEVRESDSLFTLIEQMVEIGAELLFNVRGEEVIVNIQHLRLSDSSFNIYVPCYVDNKWISIKLMWFINELYLENNLTVLVREYDELKLIKEWGVRGEDKEYNGETLHSYSVDFNNNETMPLTLDGISIVFSTSYLQYLLKIREGYKVYLEGLESSLMYMREYIGEIEEVDVSSEIDTRRTVRTVSDINLSIKFKRLEDNNIDYLFGKIWDDEEFKECLTGILQDKNKEDLTKMFYIVKEYLGTSPVDVIQSKGFIDGIQCLEDSGIDYSKIRELKKIVNKEVIKLNLDINKIKLNLLAFRYNLGDLYDKNELMDYSYNYLTTIEKKGFEK